MIGKKVRYVDNDSVTKLTEDKIYTVSNTTQNDDGEDMYELEEVSGRFYVYRFEPVEEKLTSKSMVVSATLHLLSSDQEEERLWSIFTAPHPGHCKCGTLKSECDYHK